MHQYQLLICDLTSIYHNKKTHPTLKEQGQGELDGLLIELIKLYDTDAPFCIVIAADFIGIQTDSLVDKAHHDGRRTFGNDLIGV